tara:strand:- start:7034 stop:7324 length:291 start_codon:yes stop_codon:yes gene_type:complete
MDAILKGIESILKFLASAVVVIAFFYFAVIGFKSKYVEVTRANSPEFKLAEELCAYQHNTKNFEIINSNIFCIKVDGSYHFVGWNKQALFEEAKEH